MTAVDSTGPSSEKLALAWQATRAELIGELRTHQRTKRLSWNDWLFKLFNLAYWNNVLQRTEQYSAVPLGGVFLVLVAGLPLLGAWGILERADHQTGTGWVVLTSIFSLIWTSGLLADQLPHRPGWRVLLYPVVDHNLKHFLRWRISLTIFIHSLYAVSAVVPLVAKFGWDATLGLSFALLQGIFLTSIQVILLRVWLPDYSGPSRAMVALLLGSLIFAIPALFLAMTSPTTLPSLMPWLPLTWCLWIWSHVETGLAWAWLWLLPVALACAGGVYARFAIPHASPTTVIDGQFKIAQRNAKRLKRDYRWFLQNYTAEVANQASEARIEACIMQRLDPQQLPLWERWLYRAEDRWHVPLTWDVTWRGGVCWTVFMLIFTVPFAWIPGGSPNATLWLTSLVILIGLCERGLWFHEPSPWLYPIDFARFSRIVFRRQCGRIVLYAGWLIWLLALLGCFCPYPLLDSLVAIGMAITISMAQVPLGLAICAMRCSWGEERLELLVPYATLLVAGPAAMFYLLALQDFRLHWSLAAIPPTQAILNAGFWWLAMIMYYRTKNPIHAEQTTARPD